MDRTQLGLTRYVLELKLVGDIFERYWGDGKMRLAMLAAAVQ